MNNKTVIGKAGNFNICFRDVALSSNSGVVLLIDFIDKLGLAKLLDSEIKVKQRESGYSEAEAILAMVFNFIVGGESLSDLNVLRGDEGSLKLMEVDNIIAPTTAGEHLRKFSIGDICDFIRVLSMTAQQVRRLQISSTCTFDFDTSILEQCSTRKEGSCKGYNGVVGYNPMFAFWAEEGELLRTHLLAGNRHPASKAIWFLRETLKCAPEGKERKLRADSAFYAWDFIKEVESHQITYAISADMSEQLRKQIEKIEEKDWKRYDKDKAVEVAELRYAPGRHQPHRYVVKREKRRDKFGGSYWKYHVVITNDEKTSAAKLMKWALKRCNMENQIKEYKSGIGIEKLPTQKFHANWVWLLIGQLAFNLVVWFKRLILPEHYHSATIKTIRHHIVKLAGKIVESGRRFFLVLSEHYLYQDVWRYALKQLAKLAT